MAKNCKGCKHWRSSSINNADMGFVCHYLLDTGGNKVKIDGVCQQYDSTPYNKNDKYEEGYKKMPRAKIDDHEAAIRLFENGKTVTEVTAITGFAYKTVWRWHRDWKKDNAPIGNVSPEVAERLKEIGEKTGIPVSYNYSNGADDDENIYAYDGSMSPEDFEKRIDMAQKNEPVTAPTATNSKQVTPIDTPIIPEITKNVKHCYSSAAAEAVYLAYMDKLSEVAEFDSRVSAIDKMIEYLNEQKQLWADRYFFALDESDRLWADYERINGND
jgi:hypothetical protein